MEKHTKNLDTYHYHVIKRAIEVLDGSSSRLSLGSLAEKMNMSPYHFQKIFSQWAGVSPKNYEQYLELNLAKTLIKNKLTMAHVAQCTGLSSSGRLHDLFIKWETISPGEFARGGAGIDVFYGWCDTPFGDTLAMCTKKGLCGLGFSDGQTRDTAQSDLMKRWPQATYIQDESFVAPFVDAAIGGGELNLHMIGAPFQIKVWEALMSIPSGYVTTYSHIAEAIGNPKAVRAVGTAVGRNPVSWLIPCHRVLRKSGELGGYHWGLPLKRALLAYEAIQAEHGAR